MIWIARHGETTWNVAGRYQGRLESPLSSRGERQAAALGAAFGGFRARGASVPERIVSSPLSRCAETAAAVANELGLDVEHDERLIEIAHGTWEGRFRDDLAANDPERYRAWRSDPARVAFDGGEALTDVLARWRSFARDLARRREPTLVVTHDAVVRCALVDLLGRPLDDLWRVTVENAAYARALREHGSLRLLDECVTSHLDGIRADTAEQAL